MSHPLGGRADDLQKGRKNSLSRWERVKVSSSGGGGERMSGNVVIDAIVGFDSPGRLAGWQVQVIGDTGRTDLIA